MTVIIFLAVLFVLILVHEWGHFIVAKKTDMQVDEFAVGFPPRLISRRIGETEYVIGSLPIGGYVRILGENAEDIAAGAEAAVNDRSFMAKPRWAQAAVLVAGVTMNIIFAWILYIVVFMMGVPTVVDEAVASQDAALTVTSVVPDSPAAKAEIPVGAIITAVVAGEVAIDALTPTAFQNFVATQRDTVFTITYAVNEVDFITTLTPTTDVLAEDPERVLAGVSLGLVEDKMLSAPAALIEATKTTGSLLVAITLGLGSFFGALFTGSADFTQIAGPVGIGVMVGDAAAFGLTSLLLFTAVISLNLAVINMLPFPALDGGRLVMVGIEAVTRRSIDPKWVARVNGLGILLLLTLMVLVTYNDIIKLL